MKINKKFLSGGDSYPWKYVSVGGVVRVAITQGEDIAHLDELDQKKWTVLSCPVRDLNADPVTLGYLDGDNDGKIQVDEMRAAAKWLTSVVKDRNLIVKGDDVLPLDAINRSCADGEALYLSAKRILLLQGIKKKAISLADALKGRDVFNKSKFNGDGVVVPETAEDAATAAVIADAVACTGGTDDRSGAKGLDEKLTGDFFAAVDDALAWRKAGEDKAVLPYGDDTAAAYAAYSALKEKVEDFYMRCRMVAFDSDMKDTLGVNRDTIAGVASGNISASTSEIASCPLAKPSADALLHFDAVNPAWSAKFEAFKSIVMPKAKEMTSEKWASICGSFAAYEGWLGAQKGAAVASLSTERLKEIAASGSRDAILSLIARDKALAAEGESIEGVSRLMHLFRDYYKVLRNYVIFSDFYNRKDGGKALFEAGDLYVDERCCHLCIKVNDMSAHADIPALSGMFLIYCNCLSYTGEKMDIVAVMTAGQTNNLYVGKNALFIDRKGNSWDARITKIVDNPINIPQAFWSPYRKTWNFLKEKLGKSAAEKENASVAGLQGAVDSKGGAAPAQPFDIAKFAGIFAAIGMAVGYIASAVVGIVKGVAALKLWQLLVLIALLMLLISGPSCFIAWMKLRRRNLGPVLNANGWAINSLVRVNIMFGATLTTTAKYPVMKLPDPYRKKTPVWKKILRWIILIFVVGFGALYFTNSLECCGLGYCKGDVSNRIKSGFSNLDDSFSNGLQEAATAAEEPSASATAAQE